MTDGDPQTRKVAQPHTTRHSHESRNPDPVGRWTPACAGVTKKMDVPRQNFKCTTLGNPRHAQPPAFGLQRPYVGFRLIL